MNKKDTGKLPYAPNATLAGIFTKINRDLMSANDTDEWQPAVAAMTGFLDQVESHYLDKHISQYLPTDISRLLSILLTVSAESGQYRFEQFKPGSVTDQARLDRIRKEMLPAMGGIRQHAIGLAKSLLSSDVFSPISIDIQNEIFPLLDSLDPQICPDRHMPFRVIQIANIVDRLYNFRLRVSDPLLNGDANTPGLLREIYDRKYLRFGTSGVRGRWGYDFTETRARQVVQAICDFLKNDNVPVHVGGEDLRGRRIIVGYDSRRNARKVAEWVAEVCLGNGFTVDIPNRDTPTPVLVYYLTDYMQPDEVAGLINCTASHNPPEWQGIKFNPRLGYPAATNITDYIAFRINEMQLLDESAKTDNLDNAQTRGLVRGFDPISNYTKWILDSGNGNRRIKLNVDRMHDYFKDKHIIIDEMHGAGRAYLSKVLGEIGIPHSVIHAERDPELPGLDYANPEEPFINSLKSAVKETGADLGVGLDTDADRFGIVDRGGNYFRPNQILPMLVKYLGVDRELTGRVIATQTGSPLIEPLAALIKDNEENKPAKGVLPSYVGHPFYKLIAGDINTRILEHAFMVPVGIKYIEEIRRTDANYKALKELPDGWRDVILIGGEESSGLTSRGHVTDKDGIWADLLVLDMLAYYGTRTVNPLNAISEIWDETVNMPGCWHSYGGAESGGSHSGRVDVDAILEAKEAFIDHYLEMSPSEGVELLIGNMKVDYLGGIRYDIAEMQLRAPDGNNKHYLRVRASGTEPINRIYVESSHPELGKQIMRDTLNVLEDKSIEQVTLAYSPWRLVDILVQTKISPKLIDAVEATIKKSGWDKTIIISNLSRSLPELENRNRKVAQAWLAALK
ncbi:MAG: hypothetical protein HPY76_03055 [Anaerolineae bacterium]|nr:hypothetical protein [Anaerolineae bacterium]